jgi:hypothetical protein
MQPVKTQIEINLEERAARERQEDEAAQQALIASLAPEPLPCKDVMTFQPVQLPTKQLSMEPADRETGYVEFQEYKKAMDLFESDAPNGRLTINLEFSKVVDLLRHAVGCLEALGTTTDMNGTVAERLEQSRKVATDTATGIKESLGI